jgi:DNA repair protein RecO (recombination protein O)
MKRSTAPLAAYLLHRYDWSESSLIVELFTRDQGRVVAAAKGAKRPYSQLRPVLLPFQRLQVLLGKVPEGGEVQALRSAEWAGGGAPMLAGDALFRGFYCNELLLKLLARHDPHARLFDAYAATLPALAGDELPAQAALRAFELALLRDVGLLPDLSAATTTQNPVQPGARYTLRAEAGVVAVGDGGDAALGGQLLLDLQAALDEPGDAAALRAACARGGTALRTLLRGLLHYHLGTPQLRTRNVLQGAQQLRATTPPR